MSDYLTGAINYLETQLYLVVPVFGAVLLVIIVYFLGVRSSPVPQPRVSHTADLNRKPKTKKKTKTTANSSVANGRPSVSKPTKTQPSLQSSKPGSNAAAPSESNAAAPNESAEAVKQSQTLSEQEKRTNFKVNSKSNKSKAKKIAAELEAAAEAAAAVEGDDEGWSSIKRGRGKVTPRPEPSTKSKSTKDSVKKVAPAPKASSTEAVAEKRVIESVATELAVEVADGLKPKKGSDKPSPIEATKDKTKDLPIKKPTQAKPTYKSKSETQSDSKSKSETQSDSTSKSNSQPKLESKLQSKLESKWNSKPESNIKSKSSSKVESKSEVEQESKSEATSGPISGSEAKSRSLEPISDEAAGDATPAAIAPDVRPKELNMKPVAKVETQSTEVIDQSIPEKIADAMKPAFDELPVGDDLTAKQQSGKSLKKRARRDR